MITWVFRFWWFLVFFKNTFIIQLSLGFKPTEMLEYRLVVSRVNVHLLFEMQEWSTKPDNELSSLPLKELLL